MPWAAVMLAAMPTHAMGSLGLLHLPPLTDFQFSSTTAAMSRCTIASVLSSCLMRCLGLLRISSMASSHRRRYVTSLRSTVMLCVPSRRARDSTLPSTLTGPERGHGRPHLQHSGKRAIWDLFYEPSQSFTPRSTVGSFIRIHAQVIHATHTRRCTIQA